jgi:hypothetical protein
MDRNSCCLASGILAFVSCLSFTSMGLEWSLAALPITTIAMWTIWRAWETQGREEESNRRDSACPNPSTREAIPTRGASRDARDVHVARSVPPRPWPFKTSGALVHENASQ